MSVDLSGTPHFPEYFVGCESMYKHICGVHNVPYQCQITSDVFKLMDSWL